jgi:hypothetical protein
MMRLSPGSPLRPGERFDPATGEILYSSAWLGTESVTFELFEVDIVARRLPAGRSSVFAQSVRVRATSLARAILAAARKAAADND